MKVIILFLLSFSAFAGGRHDHGIIINNYETNNYYDVTEITETVDPGVNNSDISAGIALAIATNHPFSYLTPKWQGSINASRYDGETGLSFGVAKRFKSVDALFHGSYSRSSDDYGMNAGMVWRF